MSPGGYGLTLSQVESPVFQVFSVVADSVQGQKKMSKMAQKHLWNPVEAWLRFELLWWGLI